MTRGGEHLVIDYQSAKVAELTAPQPMITRLLSLAIILVGLLGASLLSTSSAVTPSIRATFSQALTIDYLLKPSPTAQQCQRVLREFTKSISGACPQCEIKTSCATGNTYSQSIHALSNNTLVARLPNGIAAYITDDLELAQGLCASTAAVDGGIGCTTAAVLAHKPCASSKSSVM